MSTTLNRVAIIASACCAIHCSVTPLLLVLIPTFWTIPDKWHDGFIWASVVLGLILTAKTAWQRKRYSPFGFAIASMLLAIVGHELSHSHWMDFAVGTCLVLAHWFNHEKKVCSHRH
jgi:uncharacterized membrane protein YhhN